MFLLTHCEAVRVSQQSAGVVLGSRLGAAWYKFHSELSAEQQATIKVEQRKTEGEGEGCVNCELGLIWEVLH